MAIALALAAGLRRRLRYALPVLFAVATLVAANTVWEATPTAVSLVSGGRADLAAFNLSSSGIYLGTTVIATAIWWRWLPENTRLRLRPTAVSWRALIWTLGMAVAFLIGLFGLPAGWLGREAVAPIQLGQEVVWAVPSALMLSAAQEIQFRGLLLGALEEAWPAPLANIGQAAFFGLAHIAVQYEGPAGPLIPVVVAIGLLLGVATQRTRSLWPAVLVHGLADVSVLLLILPGLYGGQARAGWWQPAGLQGHAVSQIVERHGEVLVRSKGGWFRWLSPDHLVPAQRPAPQPRSVPSGPAPPASRPLVAAPAALPGVSFEAAGTRVWRREAGGRWSLALVLLPDHLFAPAPAITSIAAFSKPLTPALYLGTAGYSVLESDDGGYSWVRFGPGLPRKVTGLVADAGLRSVLAATSDGIWIHHLSSLPAPVQYRTTGLYWRWLAIIAIALAAVGVALVVLMGWARRHPAGAG